MQNFNFKDELKTIYKRKAKIDPLVEGLDLPEQSLEDYYVKIQMIVKEEDKKLGGGAYATESIDGQKEDISLSDLFSIPSKNTLDKLAHRILISGGAGVGKTTTMQFIAQKWALGELWSDKFDYVYFINLKTILNNNWTSSPWYYEADELNESRLRGLAHYSLNLTRDEKHKISPRNLPWFEASKASSRILLLLDGFDEVSHLRGKPEYTDIFEEISEFENVIITSRPYAVDEKLKAKFDCLVEITGLDKEGVEKFVDRYFQKETHKREGLMKFLDTHTVVKDICKIPLNITMICCMWLHSEDHTRIKGIYNTSVLYKEMVNFLGKMYLHKKSGNHEHSNPLEIPEIKILSHAAYKGLTGGVATLLIPGAVCKYNKDKAEINLNDADGISLQSSINYMEKLEGRGLEVSLNHLYKYGLLKTEGHISTESKDQSDSDLQKQTFSFIHPTIQEYCAAHYLKHQLEKGDKKERRDICRLLGEHRNEPQYAMTLKFLAGIISADQSKENDEVVKMFWEAMTCNVDGIIEIGIEMKVGLVLHLLGQAKINLDELDHRIPNKQEIVDFIDAVVIKDISTYYGHLRQSGYMSETIQEGIIRDMIEDKKQWHISKMKNISNNFNPAIKAAIDNMLQGLETDKNKSQVSKTGRRYEVQKCRKVEIGMSFLNEIKEPETRERYFSLAFNELLNLLEKCKSEHSQLITLVLEKIEAMTSQHSYLHEKIGVVEFINKVTSKIRTSKDGDQKISNMLNQIMSRIENIQDEADHNLLKEILIVVFKKDKNCALDIKLAKYKSDSHFLEFKLDITEGLVLSCETENEAWKNTFLRLGIQKDDTFDLFNRLVKYLADEDSNIRESALKAIQNYQVLDSIDSLPSGFFKLYNWFTTERQLSREVAFSGFMFFAIALAKVGASNKKLHDKNDIDWTINDENLIDKAQNVMELQRDKGFEFKTDPNTQEISACLILLAKSVQVKGYVIFDVEKLAQNLIDVVSKKEVEPILAIPEIFSLIRDSKEKEKAASVIIENIFNPLRSDEERYLECELASYKTIRNLMECLKDKEEYICKNVEEGCNISENEEIALAQVVDLHRDMVDIISQIKEKAKLKELIQSLFKLTKTLLTNYSTCSEVQYNPADHIRSALLEPTEDAELALSFLEFTVDLIIEGIYEDESNSPIDYIVSYLEDLIKRSSALITEDSEVVKKLLSFISEDSENYKLPAIWTLKLIVDQTNMRKELMTEPVRQLSSVIERGDSFKERLAWAVSLLVDVQDKKDFTQITFEVANGLLKNEDEEVRERAKEIFFEMIDKKQDSELSLMFFESLLELLWEEDSGVIDAVLIVIQDSLQKVKNLIKEDSMCIQKLMRFVEKNEFSVKTNSVRTLIRILSSLTDNQEVYSKILSQVMEILKQNKALLQDNSEEVKKVAQSIYSDVLFEVENNDLQILFLEYLIDLSQEEDDAETTDVLFNSIAKIFEKLKDVVSQDLVIKTTRKLLHFMLQGKDDNVKLAAFKSLLALLQSVRAEEPLILDFIKGTLNSTINLTALTEPNMLNFMASVTASMENKEILEGVLKADLDLIKNGDPAIQTVSFQIFNGVTSIKNDTELTIRTLEYLLDLLEDWNDNLRMGLMVFVLILRRVKESIGQDLASRAVTKLKRFVSTEGYDEIKIIATGLISLIQETGLCPQEVMFEVPQEEYFTLFETVKPEECSEGLFFMILSIIQYLITKEQDESIRRELSDRVIDRLRSFLTQDNLETKMSAYQIIVKIFDFVNEEVKPDLLAEVVKEAFNLICLVPNLLDSTRGLLQELILKTKRKELKETILYRGEDLVVHDDEVARQNAVDMCMLLVDNNADGNELAVMYLDSLVYQLRKRGEKEEGEEEDAEQEGEEEDGKPDVDSTILQAIPKFIEKGKEVLPKNFRTAKKFKQLVVEPKRNIESLAFLYIIKVIQFEEKLVSKALANLEYDLELIKDVVPYLFPNVKNQEIVLSLLKLKSAKLEQRVFPFIFTKAVHKADSPEFLPLVLGFLPKIIKDCFESFYTISLFLDVICEIEKAENGIVKRDFVSELIQDILDFQVKYPNMQFKNERLCNEVLEKLPSLGEKEELFYEILQRSFNVYTWGVSFYYHKTLYNNCLLWYFNNIPSELSNKEIIRKLLNLAREHIGPDKSRESKESAEIILNYFAKNAETVNLVFECYIEMLKDQDVNMVELAIGEILKMIEEDTKEGKLLIPEGLISQTIEQLMNFESEDDSFDLKIMKVKILIFVLDARAEDKTIILEILHKFLKVLKNREYIDKEAEEANALDVYKKISTWIATLDSPIEITMDYMMLPVPSFKLCLYSAFCESFKDLLNQLQLVDKLFKRKEKSDTQDIIQHISDMEIETRLKERIIGQINSLKQENAEVNLVNLRHRLNCVGKVKSYELIEIALRLMEDIDELPHNQSNTDNMEIINRVLQLQIEAITAEGLEWINHKMDALMLISKHNMTYFKLIYHKLLEDSKFTAIKESLLMKLINLGLKTSITRKGEVIFEGKRYTPKGKNIEELLERISHDVIRQKKDPLAIQYEQHEPIFKMKSHHGMREASCDLKKLFNLSDRTYELPNDKWLLTEFTRINSNDNSKLILIIEQRNTLGDHVIHDLNTGMLWKIHPEDEEKVRKILFGEYEEALKIRYYGQAKVLAKSSAGYHMISSHDPEIKLEFDKIEGTELYQSGVHFQQELLNKGHDDRYAWFTSELDKIKLNPEDKTKLMDYYETFLRTFTEAYAIAQVAESEKSVLNPDSAPTTSVISTLLCFIPVAEGKIASTKESVDTLMKTEEIKNSTRRMKLLASSRVDLYLMISKTAFKIIMVKEKQKQIITDDFNKEKSSLLAEILNGDLVDSLGTELAKMINPELYAEAYKSTAAKLGDSDAIDLIHKWINNSINVENTQDAIINKFVEEATLSVKPMLQADESETQETTLQVSESETRGTMLQANESEPQEEFISRVNETEPQEILPQIIEPEPKMVRPTHAVDLEPQNTMPQADEPETQEFISRDNESQPQEEFISRTNELEPQEVMPQIIEPEPKMMRPTHAVDLEPQNTMPQADEPETQEFISRDNEVEPEEIIPQIIEPEPKTTRPQAIHLEPQNTMPQADEPETQEFISRDNDSETQEFISRDNEIEPQEIMPQIIEAEPKKMRPTHAIDLEPQNTMSKADEPGKYAALKKKVEEGIISLEEDLAKISLLTLTHKEKLISYYKSFIRTFIESYLIVQNIKGQEGNSESIKNGAEKFQNLANSDIELFDLVDNSAKGIIRNEAKRVEINNVTGKEEYTAGFFEELLMKKPELAEVVKNDLSFIIGDEPKKEYLPAAKFGNSEANQVIRQWIAGNININTDKVVSSRERQEGIKKQLIKKVTLPDYPIDTDENYCCVGCCKSCQLF